MCRHYTTSQKDKLRGTGLLEDSDDEAREAADDSGARSPDEETLSSEARREFGSSDPQPEAEQTFEHDDFEDDDDFINRRSRCVTEALGAALRTRVRIL